MNTLPRTQMNLNDGERFELVSLYLGGISSTKACDLFHQKYPHKSRPHPSTCRRLLRRLQEAGSLRRRSGPGRPVAVASDEIVERVLSIVRGKPQSSIRKLSVALGISKSTVLRILHKNGFHPYKFRKVQHLQLSDKSRRVDWCNWLLEELKTNPTLLEDIIFTDESIFYLNGNVSDHHNHYWSPENMHIPLEVHHQWNPRVMVWCGIHGTRVIGPFFFDEHVTSKRIILLIFVCL